MRERACPLRSLAVHHALYISLNDSTVNDLQQVSVSPKAKCYSDK